MVPINYFAVVVSALVGFGLGWLWYGPLFGKQWIALMGWSEEAVAAQQAKGMSGMKMQFSVQLVGALLMAFVLAHAIIFAGAYLQVSGVAAGLEAAIWNWLGFIAPVTVGDVLWSGKPWKLWMLNAGYYLVSLLVMGVILGYWA